MQNFTSPMILTLLLSLSILPACNKVIDLHPKTEIDTKLVFSDDQTATSAVIGQYAKFMENISMLNGQLSRYLSLYADELSKNGSNALDNSFLKNDLKPDNEIVAACWHFGYNYIYHTNATLEQLSASKGISTSTRKILEGETKFIRALVYFYLVNLYGDIPLILQSDLKNSIRVPRMSESTIYDQIIKDLKDAQQQLPLMHSSQPSISVGPIRATQYAAATLLGRVYLYRKQWQEAINLCTFVIESQAFCLESDPNKSFLAESREAILSLYPTTTMYNSAEGRTFNINPATGKPAFLLTEHLTSTFESSDLRLTKWMKMVNTATGPKRIPFKYKVYGTNDPTEIVKVTEQTILLRLPELYLMRAEAYAAIGEYNKAVNDINSIRDRAKASKLPISFPSAKISMAIEQEYQQEFFAELGHRWFYLIRSKSNDPSTPGMTRADDILSIRKPGDWKSYKRYWPIPKDELLKSSELFQNPGYEG